MPIFSREQLYTSGNKARTTALIREFCKPTDTPIMCLSPIRDDLPSIQNLFIEHTVDDPSEVTFAEEVFGSMAYWCLLRKNRRLQPYLEAWRQIAEEKRKSKAFKHMMKEIQEGGRSAYSAAKFLIEEPWKDKRKQGVAKKSKESTAKAFGEIEEDFERLQEEGFLN